MFAPSKRRKRINKKRVSRAEFDRKMKIWSLVVPLIVALIGSVQAVSIALLSTGSENETRPGPQALPAVGVIYDMAPADRRELGRIRESFNEAILLYREVGNPSYVELDSVLTQLAAEEADIVKKYDPTFFPRYPPPAFMKTGVLRVFFIIVLIVLAPVIFIVLFSVLRVGSRLLLHLRYDVNDA